MITATKVEASVVQMSLLTLDPMNNESMRMAGDPDFAHKMLMRCAPYGRDGDERTLFLVERDNKNATIIVQTPTQVEWVALGADGLIAREETWRSDLSQFENGSKVKIETLAAATMHAGTPQAWEARTFEGEELVKYAKLLKLDLGQIESLGRSGIQWRWKLKNGTAGVQYSGHKAKRPTLSSEDECRAWFLNQAFAIRTEHGNLTGKVAVEFEDVSIGPKCITRVIRARGRHGKQTGFTLAPRRYTATVVVTDARTFVGRLMGGIGYRKDKGLGLVKATLVR